MKTLYEITGNINDINTLLVNKREYDSLVDAANTKPEIDPCIDGSCGCCWSHLDETEPSTIRLQPTHQPLSALPDGDIVFFSDRGDAVTGYSAQRVWEILSAHGIGGDS